MKPEFNKFMQFQKMEDSEDGPPVIWGIATLEEPDSDAEIADYDTAKPVYQAWSSKALKRTKGAGQEPSLGNLRLMHGSEIGGKATKLEFRDDAKEIWLGSEPVNDAVHQMLKGGFLTGYSQGGSYAWRACNVCEGQMPMQQGANWCETCGKNVIVRYGLKKLAEVSYVDSPAIGIGFESVKSNGSCEIVKFQKKTEAVVAKDKKTKRVAGEDLESSAFAYVGDPDKTETWKLPIKFSNDEKTKRHIRNALARFEQTKGIPEDKKEEVKAKIHAAATAHGIDVTEPSAKSAKVRDMLKSKIDAQAESKGLQKGLYAVGQFANLLESYAYLLESALWEREMEGDDSDVPDEMRDQLDDMIDTFISMAEEEAKELAARNVGKTEKGDTPMTPEELELQKAAKKSLATHFAKAAAHHTKMADHHEAMEDHHEEIADAHKAMHEKMAKLDTNEGGQAEGGPGKEVVSSLIEFHKAAHKEHEGLAKKHGHMAKAHDAHAEHCDKMAGSCDEETAKSVSKSEAEAYEVEKKAAGTVAAPVVKTDGDDFIARATKQAQENLMKNPEFIKELETAQKAALISKLSAQSAEALAQEQVKPTGVTIVPRAGGTDAKKFQFAQDAETSATGVGF